MTAINIKYALRLFNLKSCGFYKPVSGVLSTLVRCRTTTTAIHANAKTFIIESLQSKSNENLFLKKHLQINSVSAIADYFLSIKLPEEEIVRVFEHRPDFSTVSPKVWRENFQILTDSGVPVDSVISIFEKCPRLLNCSADDIVDKIEDVRKLGFSGAVTLAFIKYVPQVCLIDIRSLLQRLELLKEVFRVSDIAKLLEVSPNAFVEDWREIESKLYYINYEMILDQRHVVRSGALNYPLKYIVLRHTFLKRAGIYKKPNPRQPVQIKTNPKLYKILNTSDSKFIREVAPSLSLEEYCAFKEAFELEYEKEEPSSDLSDDDTDSDSS